MIGPMHRYFAYGSNLRQERLEARVGIVVPLGPARIEGFALRFDKPGRDGTGKANLVRRPGEVAWGVCYELSETGLLELDRFEPGYERVLYPVEDRGGMRLDAQVYLHPERATGGPPTPAPSLEYLSHLLDGGREHGLPAEWLALVRSVARVG